ncbi:fasciclin domain-containing protein [Aurantiacibacter sediminis]|uniref:Fasciclin domain-containing protein n=1 Tax=Aurantiacibacter sediminis TaxID=2793064 RepID=A0ABS0N4F2_9SPHN|nr:fasciclin domain-containing protein [Aurantiacibacter sediminis]MBH5321884.1 fasciclin domain-containing protein [Aurantiacibacter sediminis]
MKKLTIALASAASLAIVACAEPAEEENTMADETSMEDDAMANEGPGTIVDVASGNGDFSTLVTAVTAAELGETLSGEGPFTVFAPTNAAFDALPDGTVDTLVNEDTETLSSILTYHVVEGNLMAADVMSAIEGAGEEGYTVNTVGGGTFTASVVDGNVVLTDATGGTATVTDTDIEASNGVIHVIDTVLMPQ